MSNPAVAFDSPDDFDRHDAARAQVEAWIRSTAKLPVSDPWYRAGASSTKTWVEITAGRIAGDPRHLYPAKFVSFDEAETSTSVAPKWDESFEPEALERKCVCIAPNGAVLKKYSRHEGQVYGTVVVPEPDPEEFAGVLDVRSSDVAGRLEMTDVDHAFQVGDVIKIEWADGFQTSQIVTEVGDDGVKVLFSGGGTTPEESVLPSVGTVVTVTRVRSVEIAVVMVDVMDASTIVRIVSVVPDPDTGYFDAYVRQPTGVGVSSMEDGERIWVKNYREDVLDATIYAGAQFVTRLPHSESGRAVYGLAENDLVAASGSGSGGSTSGSGTVGYVCLGPFQTVAQCGYASDGVTPRLEVTTKYVTITATIDNGRIRFTTSESDEPCGGGG